MSRSEASKARIFSFLFATPDEKLTGIRRHIVRTGRVAYLTLREAKNDFCLEKASGLAFATIISLIPLAVLFFSIAGKLGGGDEIIKYVKEHLPKTMAPDFQAQITDLLDTYISKSAFDQGPTGVVNVMAIIGLLTAAVGVMVTAERYLNIIWDVQNRRSYLQKLTNFWLILTLSPMLIALSIWLGEMIMPKGGALDSLQQQSVIIRSVSSLLVSLIMGFLGFTTLYLFLPATRVRVASAAVGAAVAAILWELLRHLFFLYVAKAATISSFYPKLASIPLFLVWIYSNWLIVLIGAEVGHVHQNLKAYCKEIVAPVSTGGYSRMYFGLSLLTALREAFTAGHQPPPLEDVARELGVSVEAIHGVAELLVERGYIIEDARNPGRYALAQAPSGVALRAVMRELAGAEFPSELHLADGGGLMTAPGKQSTPAQAEVARAWVAFLGAFGQRTLA